MSKKIRYVLEYILIWCLYGVFRILPWRSASNLGGFIGRMIGPRLGISRRAKRHIKLAFPEKSDDEVKQILMGMWDNLARVFAESPHLKTMSKEACKNLTPEIVDRLKNDGKAGIFCGAHYANWELAIAALADQGLCLHSVYRNPNNPYVAKLLEKMRTHKEVRFFRKSRAGMMQIVKTLSQNEHVGLLIDQKFNAGPETLFFGHTVKTSTAFAELAFKYNCPLHFGRMIRRDKTAFELEFTEEIPLTHDNGTPKSEIELIDEYHAYLEKWITEYPEQWLWIHRRWKDV